MPDSQYFGLESYFNDNVTFYKDVTINGNLNYDSLSVNNLTVNGKTTLGITTSTNLSAELINIKGDSIINSVTISSGIVTATKFVGIISSPSGNKLNQVQFTTDNRTIISGITWSSSYNGTTQLLGDVTGASGDDIKAINISVYYIHNTSGPYHGYLTGYIHQTGKPYSTGTLTNNLHYDWYYNIIETPLIIPWDPSGTQSLSMYVVDAYNTSSTNQYSIFQRGVIKQE